MLTENTPTADELWKQLDTIADLKAQDNNNDDSYLLTITDEQKFYLQYEYILGMCRHYVPKDNGNYEINLFSWKSDSNSNQAILEGEVKDLNKPIQNSYNWHLQNTSQWLFAFGCLFDFRNHTFSIHT